MANRELISGVDTFLIYGEESTFGTKASSINKQFGLIQSISTPINRNVTQHRGFVGSSSGGQLPVKQTAGVLEASASIEFKPLEWSWLKYIFGAVSGAGSSGDPYVYAFANKPASISIAHNMNNETTDELELLLGSKIDNCTIRSQIGESVLVSSEWVVADWNGSTTLESNVSLPTGEVFNFSGSTLELPDGSEVSNIVENIEFKISRDPKKAPGLGSYNLKNILHGQAEIRLSLDFDYLNNEFSTDVRGSATSLGAITENATLTVNFTSPSGASLALKLTNVVFPEYSKEANLNEILKEKVTAYALGCTAEEVLGS